MVVTRFEKNPIITPSMVTPSRPDFKVEGTFNAGIVECEGEIIMLLRVAESVLCEDPDEIHVPTLVKRGEKWIVDVKIFERSDPKYDFSDPRQISLRRNPRDVFLTSLSHIRIARSVNGKDFIVDDRPFIAPENRYEAFGCEDARVTRIGADYYINYSSVSDLGISTSLARTRDFECVEKLGLIFAPDNRDVCLFPEKINGFYWALHRPAPLHFGVPEIWIAKSPDLIHWGDHQRLIGCSSDAWDQMKIGGGAPMVKTNKGWLQIYHGVDKSQRYCLGALLIDENDPTRVIARMESPLLEPRDDYEVDGFFSQVVFTCGVIVRDDVLHIYYGAADEVMALGTIPLKELWRHMSLDLISGKESIESEMREVV